ncbi:MAG: glycosyltransferase [Clostridium perfringens]|nr:glycosyltransferase [Clostridium perfringens]
MKITFFSNFLNHHQIPFCNEMYNSLGEDFKFIATERVPKERLQLGYKDSSNDYKYSINIYENDEKYKIAKQLANDSDVVIFGSAPREFIKSRLEKDKLTFEYSERIFKKGRIRILDPRVFRMCYKSYIKYKKNRNFHLLCASSYTAPDMKMIGVFKEKNWKWGYFPEVKLYDIEYLTNLKNNDTINILWVGRFLEWKHPEHAILVAKKLKKEGYKFLLNIIGTGYLEEEMKYLIKTNRLENNVKILGSMSPEKVREYMECSNIFLFTSSYEEGWGAVLNEAMNSGCAIVAADSIGAVKYMLKNEENGFIYKYNNINQLYSYVKKLINDEELRNKIGVNAYKSIISEWNPKVAAKRLINLSKELLNEGSSMVLYKDGPCSKG